MQKSLENQPEFVDNKRDAIGAETPTTSLTTDADWSRDDMADSHSIAGRAPAFQFYPKEYLSDAKTRAMTFAQRGMYWDLICYCWNEDGLPLDPVEIARILGASPSIFKTRDWPVIGRCFRVCRGRTIHPRLDRERAKQAEFRARQAGNGAKGGRPKKPDKPKPFQNETQTEPKKSSASPILRSASSSADSCQKVPAADARSKRPIFTSTRFVVFEWQLDDLRRLLGPSFETFDVHRWFFELSEKADAAGLVIPQRDGGKWLQEQTLAEATRRGLAVATTQQATGKTAGNAAAAARFIARRQG